MNEEEKTQKPDAGRVLLEELTRGPDPSSSVWRRAWQVLSIPVLSIVSGLILGGILIAITSQHVYAAWDVSPLEALKTGWMEVRVAYSALFTGSIGDPARIIAALQSGDGLEIRRAFNPILESLTASTPFIFGSLAVALGFPHRLV